MPTPLKRSRGPLLAAATLLALFSGNLRAIDDFPGYSPAGNDLYSTWVPGGATGVRNTNPAFIGSPYDWTGVAHTMGSTASLAVTRAFLSPVHAASAAHTSGFITNGSTYVVNADNTFYDLKSGGFDTVRTQLGGATDLSVATLSQSHIAAGTGITTYSVFDTEAAGASYAAMVGRDVFEVGHGFSSATLSPRIAATSIDSYSVFKNTNGVTTSASLQTFHPEAPIEGGDSGGPTMLPWVDPLGGNQLTILSTHSGRTTGPNGRNFNNPTAPYVDSMNALMIGEGFAVRMVGDSSTTWTGSTNGTFATASNWTSGLPAANAYVSFDGATATTRTVDFGAATGTLRGIYFGAGSSIEDFTLENGTLDLGRGGIANYADATQTLASTLSVRLTDHQYWDAINGGLAINSAVNLNGRLLVFQGDHDITVSGAITDSTSTDVGWTKYGTGTLILNSAALHDGNTWLYGGTLSLGTSGALSETARFTLANNANAVLQLNGKSQTFTGLQSVEGPTADQGRIDLGSGGRITINQAAGTTSLFTGRITGGTTGVTALRTLGITDVANAITLAGPSDYSGVTSIDGGYVMITHAGALGATGTGNETVLNSTDTVSPTLRLNFTGTMSETLVLKNTTTATTGTKSSSLLFSSTSLTLDGPIVLARDAAHAGRGTTWTLGNANSGAWVGEWHVDSVTGRLESGAASGTSTLNTLLYRSAVMHYDGVISDGTLGSALAVNHRGDGTVHLNAANTYTGATALTANTTVVHVNALSGQAGAFGNATGTVSLSGQNTAFSQTLLAAHGVTIGRNLQVNSNHTGALTIGAAADATAAYTGTLTLNRQATLQAGANSTVTFGSVLHGAGTSLVTKTGAGTVILSGTNTYTGGTAVEQGVLAVSNSFAMGGTSANSFVITSAANYGQLRFAGSTLTYGGTLTIRFDTTLLGEAVFDLIDFDAGVAAGNFTTVSVTGSHLAVLTNTGDTWTGTDTGGTTFTFNQATGDLTASAIPEPSALALLAGAAILLVTFSRRPRKN